MADEGALHRTPCWAAAGVTSRWVKLPFPKLHLPIPSCTLDHKTTIGIPYSRTLGLFRQNHSCSLFENTTAGGNQSNLSGLTDTRTPCTRSAASMSELLNYLLENEESFRKYDSHLSQLRRRTLLT